MHKANSLSMILSSILLVFLSTATFAADISSEADKYMARGEAAVENAQDVSDYEDAVREFGKAIEIAPDRADVYYNLSIAQEGAGRYREAIKSLKRYIDLTDDVTGAQEAERKTYKLEYLAEKSETKKEIKPVEDPVKKLEGIWIARIKIEGTDFYYPNKNPHEDTFRIESYGDKIKLVEVSPEYYKNHYNAEPDDVLFRLTLMGTELTGIHHQRFSNPYGCNPPRDVKVIGDVSRDGETITLNYTQVSVMVWDKGNNVYVPDGVQNLGIKVVLKRSWWD